MKNTTTMLKNNTFFFINCISFYLKGSQEVSSSPRNSLWSFLWKALKKCQQNVSLKGLSQDLLPCSAGILVSKTTNMFRSAVIPKSFICLLFLAHYVWNLNPEGILNEPQLLVQWWNNVLTFSRAIPRYPFIVTLCSSLKHTLNDCQKSSIHGWASTRSAAFNPFTLK